MAQAADNHRDKALWLTLAQSWVRLAEHVTHAADPIENTVGPAALPSE